MTDTDRPFDAAKQATDQMKAAGERMQAAGTQMTEQGSQLGLTILSQAESNTQEAFKAMRDRKSVV